VVPEFYQHNTLMNLIDFIDKNIRTFYELSSTPLTRSGEVYPYLDGV